MTNVINKFEDYPKFKPLDLIIFNLKHKFIGIILLKSFFKHTFKSIDSSYIVVYYLKGAEKDNFYVKSLEEIIQKSSKIKIINLEKNPMNINNDDTFIKYINRKYFIANEICKIVNKQGSYRFCRHFNSFMTCDNLKNSFIDKFIVLIKGPKIKYNYIYMIYKKLGVFPENIKINWKKVNSSNLFRYQSHLINKYISEKVKNEFILSKRFRS